MPRFTFVLAALALLVVPTGAAAAQLGVVGDDSLAADRTETWTALSELSVQRVRVDVLWPAVAPTQPSSPTTSTNRAYDWTVVDARVRAAAGAGRSVVLAVGGTPEWARADGGRGGSPNDPAWNPRRTSWRNFITALATRYSGTVVVDGQALPRVDAFEIWPRPNLATSLRPQRMASRLVAPGLFRQIVSGASAEIRKVAATYGYTPTIIAGGVARTLSSPQTDTSPQAFIRGMGRTRLSVDAVGVRLSPPGGVEGAVEEGGFSIADAGGIVATVDAAWPGRGMPVWITGYGAASGPAQAGLSDATQSAAVTAFLGAAANPRVAVAVWQGLQDTATAPFVGLRTTTAEGAPVGTPKPAWSTWTTIVPPPPPPA